MKLTRNHYPVMYKRESFYLLIMTAILKKVSENETRMCNLCTLNGKKLDTGHNSSPNSELLHWMCFGWCATCWIEIMWQFTIQKFLLLSTYNNGCLWKIPPWFRLLVAICFNRFIMSKLCDICLVITLYIIAYLYTW